MMAKTKAISWADSTFNPWIGCTKVNQGCDHCYAERQMDRRLGRVLWGASKPRRRTSANYWRQPVRWNARADVFRECGACGWRGDLAVCDDPTAFACPSCGVTDWRPARRRVFCASLADVFDGEVPREWRYDLLWLMSETPNLDWLLLTKRVGNAQQMLEHECSRMGFAWPEKWPNVWLGASVCNQREFQRDVPTLLQTPAAVRFISAEPLLEPIDMDCVPRPPMWPEVTDDICHGISPLRYLSGPQIDWVIAGGEFGPGARSAHPDWFRSIRDECAAMRVPFFLNQLGGETADAGGCELDGKEGKAWPEQRSVHPWLVKKLARATASS